MTFDASGAFRYSMDQGLAIPAILGVATYQVFIVKIVNDQIGFNDVSTGRIVTTTRVTVADGFRTYAPGDGYLNPMIEQEFGEQLVLSDGQFTDSVLLLGPLVFPYVFNGKPGGTDPALFQPPQGSANNIQLYVQLKGSGLSPKSSYFDVKEIRLNSMSQLSYTVVLSANDRVVT